MQLKNYLIACCSILAILGCTSVVAGEECLENWYHYEEGMRMIQTKNWAQASKQFNYYLNLPEMHRCQFGVAHLGLGYTHMAMGNLSKALEEFRQAAANDLNPNARISDKAYLNIGAIYLKWNEYQEAIKAYSKVIEINPKHGDAHYYLGVAYLKAGDIEKAEKEKDEAKKLGVPFTGLEEDLAAAKNPPEKKPSEKAGGKKTKK